MAVHEFVLVQQIKNAEELEDENCGGNDGFFVHFFNYYCSQYLPIFPLKSFTYNLLSP